MLTRVQEYKKVCVCVCVCVCLTFLCVCVCVCVFDLSVRVCDHFAYSFERRKHKVKYSSFCLVLKVCALLGVAFAMAGNFIDSLWEQINYLVRYSVFFS